MALKSTKKKKWYQKLRDKYRLVIMNENTFEERFSFRLSRLNVFLSLGTTAILLIVGTVYLIAFTPLREYIPGYTDVGIQKKVYDNMIKADSLEKAIALRDLYIQNLMKVFEGKFEEFVPPADTEAHANYDTIKLRHSQEDSLLRAEIESQDAYNLTIDYNGADYLKKPRSGISSYFFFTPVKGIITNVFNPSIKHYGIDIVAEKNEAIKATLDGTVIFADWTLATGYVIAVQHTHNLISVYKHNSTLLRKSGNYVKAGEPIAIIGETGEMSTGPHLHFELWYNGSPVNPSDYMNF